jgi:hypothetical protein
MERPPMTLYLSFLIRWYSTDGPDEVFACALTFYCNHKCTLSIGRGPEVDPGSRSSTWLRDCDPKTRTRLSRRERAFFCKGRKLLVICRRGSSAVDECPRRCSRDSSLARTRRGRTHVPASLEGFLGTGSHLIKRSSTWKIS